MENGGYSYSYESYSGSSSSSWNGFETNEEQDVSDHIVKRGGVDGNNITFDSGWVQQPDGSYRRESSWSSSSRSSSDGSSDSATGSLIGSAISSGSSDAFGQVASGNAELSSYRSSYSRSSISSASSGSNGARGSSGSTVVGLRSVGYSYSLRSSSSSDGFNGISGQSAQNLLLDNGRIMDNSMLSSSSRQKSSVQIMGDSESGQTSVGMVGLTGGSLVGDEVYSQEQCGLLMNKCCNMADRGCCINQGQKCFTMVQKKCEYGSKPHCAANSRQKCQNYPVKTCRDNYETKRVVSRV